MAEEHRVDAERLMRGASEDSEFKSRFEQDSKMVWSLTDVL